MKKVFNSPTLKGSNINNPGLQSGVVITAGRGPAECCQVVAKVQKIMLDEAKENAIETKVLSRVEGPENGTLQSVVILLSGKNVKAFLKNWLGTIQWIGQSEFRKHHERKNWFIGVFEQASFEGLEMNEKEVSFQAIRSGGAGGQHVNKVSSAVRATHVPTGLQVLAQDSRSQHQNKKLALQRLHEKWKTEQMALLGNSNQQNWEHHLQLERGHAVRVFKGSDFKTRKENLNYKKTRQSLKRDLLKTE